VGIDPLAAGDVKARLLVDLMWRPIDGPRGRAVGQVTRLSADELQIRLARRARWHDGSPVCTDDAVETLAMLSGSAGWQDVAITRQSPRSLALRLPFPAFSRTVRSLRLVRAGEGLKPHTGNGPYRLERSREGWIARRCEREDLAGPPEIEFVVIGDRAKTLDAIERAEVHVAELDETGLAEALARGWSSSLTPRRPSAFHVPSAGHPAVEILGFNTRCRALSSRAIRRGLVAALDREQLARSPLGLAAACRSIFGGVKAEPSRQTRRSRRLDRCEIELSFGDGSPARADMAAQLAQQLAKVGAGIRLRPLCWGDFLQVLVAGDFEAFLMCLGCAPDDPAIGHRSLVGERGVLFSRAGSSHVDKSIDEASLAPDSRSLRRAASRVDAWIGAQAVCAPLVRRPACILALSAGTCAQVGRGGLVLERCRAGERP